MAINYPNYTQNIPQMHESDWKSDDTFTYSILSSIYKVANNNLHSIFPLNENVKECKINEEDLLDLDYCGENPNVDRILEEFKGPASYIGVWLCLAVIFTIVGIVWCMCNKCCCCCRSKKINDLDYLVNTDSDSDLRNMGVYDVNRTRIKMAWKIIVAVLMSFWILGFTFSVFMSFASNEGLRKSIFELYENLDHSLDDAELYIDTTKRQIDATFITSYGNLSDEIRKQFTSETDGETFNSEEISSQILRRSDALLLKLKNSANQPNDGDLQMPNELTGLSDALHELQKTLTQRVDPLLSRVVSIRRDIALDVEEALLKTKETLDANAYDLTNALNKIEIINDTRTELDDAEDNWLDITGSAIYGSFMGFNLILLIILLFIVIGSVVVWIGKGPAKNIGFIFYRFSIVMMFIFGWIITLIMINQFVIAGFLTQNACKAVRELENSPIEISPTLLNSGFLSAMHLDSKSSFYSDTTLQQDDDQSYTVPTYPYVVTHCKYDHSAYNSFKLEQVYNVSSIRNISENFQNDTIQAKINISRGNVFFIKNANSVYSKLYKDLMKLESFKDAVNNTPTETLYSNVHFLTASLLQEIKTLESGDIVQNLATALENIILLVDHYEEFVEDALENGIGKCQPIYKAINATLHTVCYKVFAPMATYWWGLQLLLCMFVTVIITALVSERVFK